MGATNRTAGPSRTICVASATLRMTPSKTSIFKPAPLVSGTGTQTNWISRYTPRPDRIKSAQFCHCFTIPWTLASAFCRKLRTDARNDRERGIGGQSRANESKRNSQWVVIGRLLSRRTDRTMKAETFPKSAPAREAFPPGAPTPAVSFAGEESSSIDRSKACVLRGRLGPGPTLR